MWWWLKLELMPMYDRSYSIWYPLHEKFISWEENKSSIMHKLPISEEEYYPGIKVVYTTKCNKLKEFYY